MKFSLHQHDKDEAAIYARLGEIFLGDTRAVAFVRDIAQIAHTWDDLVDGDVPVSRATISAAFHKAVIDLNLNPFFRENCATLLPVMLNGILNWHAANDLEAAGGAHALQVSHVCRCAAGDVALMVAAIIGGTDHARAHAAEIKIMMQQDSLEDYLADLVRAKGTGP